MTAFSPFGPVAGPVTETILEASLDGVLSTDEHARITYVNTAAIRIFGCPADELVGRELGEAIVPPSLREQHRRGFARYLATGDARILDQRIEVTAMRADGSEFPAELTVTRTGLPGAAGFTGLSAISPNVSAPSAR